MPSKQPILGLPDGWKGESYRQRFMAFAAFAEQVFPGGVKVRVSVAGTLTRREACQEITALVRASEAFHESIKRDPTRSCPPGSVLDAEGTCILVEPGPVVDHDPWQEPVDGK